MIEQYAAPILTASIILNALWLFGAWITVRGSSRKWFWRSLSLLVAALAIIWVTRLVGTTPAPTHTLRLPGLALNLDLALIAWHTFIIPIALLAMVVRGVALLFKAHKAAEK